MQVLFGILIAFASILVIAALRSITTLFHEFGHAIPSLIFTNKEVKVYVGTYGETTNCLKLNLGRLTLYLRLNLFDWNIGMCSHTGVKGLWKNVMIILGGPMASLLIAIPLVYYLLNSQVSELVFFLIIIFIIAAAIDFVSNLIPMGRTSDNSANTIFNDGKLLLHLFVRKRLSKEFLHIEDLFIDKKYNEAIELGLQSINGGNNDPAIFEILLGSFLKLEQYEEVLEVFKQKKGNFELSYQDYGTIGYAYLKIREFDEALKYFNHCLHLDFKDSVILNHRAHIYLEQGKLDLAIKDLNSAVFHSPNFHKAYVNRSLAAMRTNDYDFAYDDLQKALQLYDQYPWTHYHLGVYYEYKGEYKKALSSYVEAKRLEVDHHGIDYRIALMNQELDKGLS